jgi:AraC-like DNA-binding protein
MINLKTGNKENILRLSITVYVSVVTAFSIIYTLFFYYTQIYLLVWLGVLYIAIHLVWGIRTCKEEYHQLMNLIPCYFLFIAVYLFPIVLYFWKLGLFTGLLLYALIPFGAKLHFCSSKLQGWMFLCVMLVVAILVIQHFIKFDYVLENRQIVAFNIFTSILCFIYVYICLYFITKLSQEKSASSETPVSDDASATTSDLKESDPKQFDKFIFLFKKISEYFEKEKPYLDSDFSVVKLANDMNSNTSYITKAIKFNTGNNFNRYLNSFRIKYIQELFVDDKYNSYTIDHLRAKAGFKNQSTFNDTFKKQVGMTPTEYLDNLKTKRD